MRAKLGLFFIIALAGIIIGFSLAFEHNRTYFEGTPILWEDTLKHIGMEQMRSFGLIGEPTESNSTLVKAGKWRVSIFNSMGSENPDRIYYVLSVKGEFKPFPIPGGFSLPGDVEKPFIPKGFTIAIDAANGSLVYHVPKYVQDVRSATENRTTYESQHKGELRDVFEVQP